MIIIDKIKKIFRRDKYRFCKRSNLIKDSIKIENSPSGKYKLEISRYHTQKGCWAYSRGVVNNEKNNNKIADVKRNYAQFPFCWVENHPNGHDYLVCGEDYQGQTIIELDTGKRKNYLPEEAKEGLGFCWAFYKPSPDRLTLAVDGCYWAGPYEVVFVDFSNPMKELRWLKNQPQGMDSEFYDWNEDGTANIGYERIKRKSDGKWEDELTDEEQDKMYDDEDYEEVQIKTAWKV